MIAAYSPSAFWDFNLRFKLEIFKGDPEIGVTIVLISMLINSNVWILLNSNVNLIKIWLVDYKIWNEQQSSQGKSSSCIFLILFLHQLISSIKNIHIALLSNQPIGLHFKFTMLICKLYTIRITWMHSNWNLRMLEIEMLSIERNLNVVRILFNSFELFQRLDFFTLRPGARFGSHLPDRLPERLLFSAYGNVCGNRKTHTYSAPHSVNWRLIELFASRVVR